MIDILPPRKTQGVGNMLRDGALALAAGVVLFVAHEIVESAYEAPAANEVAELVYQKVDDFAMRNATIRLK
ncbi:MAG: hypothetical protein U5L95_00105 [Candidatus Saccharibacteria bacterium]|nr:hypothetical protein [Candidatus Saccharibacteria bacterium]